MSVMKKLLAASLISGACLSAASTAHASYSIVWSQVGQPPNATSIAMCGAYPNEKLYAINFDGSMSSNAAHGADSSWVSEATLSQIGSIRTIECGSNILHGLTPDSHLVQFIHNPSGWTDFTIGFPWDAKDIGSFRDSINDWHLFAINSLTNSSINTFWYNPNGSDSGWVLRGTPSLVVDRITGNISNGALVFALLHSQTQSGDNRVRLMDTTTLGFSAFDASISPINPTNIAAIAGGTGIDHFYALGTDQKLYLATIAIE